MDAEDRRAMEENMKTLVDNQHNLKYLVKQQTSVVESTINILRRTTDDVNRNFKSLVDRVNNITETVKEEYFVYRKSTKFFMVAKELQIVVEDNERVQLKMLALLIDINHGKLNPSLITPIQLQEETNKIREHIPDHLKLPGTAENQLRSIYKLLKAKATVIENRLVVSVWIPLFGDQVSQIHKMIGVPFEKLGRKMIPVLRSEYIIYNFKMDSYHLISHSELNSCQTFGENEYVCDGGWPWMDANDKSCETSPLKPFTKPNCKFDEFTADTFWTKLELDNSWIFKVFTQTTGHIQCSG
ncbi:uncharacterized protein LOC131996076 [Stomoxys calcitrans]|uniref:uncharacterized protein LOC131996076 n=1 Tax=Stomoxys calcitrans TaxID=35570 RepID=UPI0027E24A8C|nr:uncharacterized protein LOC131996076 [Stomoxys calcitrans]